MKKTQGSTFLRKLQGNQHRRVIAVVVVILWAFSLGVTPASAHALLVSSNPVSNADLPKAPAQVELSFSEWLQNGWCSIQVLDTHAVEVDLRDDRVDPNNARRLTVSLPSLADGIYTVSWRAVSAVDGHLTSGSFPFAVGPVDASVLSSTSSQSSQIPISLSAVLSKWLLIVSLAFLVGRQLFTLLVWKPTIASSFADGQPATLQPDAWNRLIRWSLIGLFIGLGWGLLVQAGELTGNELAPPWAAQTGEVLLDSRLGLIWLVRLFLALAAAWCLTSSAIPWKQWVGFVVGLALLLTLSLTSHSTAEVNPVLPVLDDWLHLVVVSIWIGGLAFFVTGMWAMRQVDGLQRTRLTSLLIVRFSNLALTCVGLLGLTGLYSAVIRIGSFSVLFKTLYGETLLLKLALAAPLLLLGAYNLLILSPRLNRVRVQGSSDDGRVALFRKVITTEVILGVAVILCSSLLSSLPPARIPTITSDLTANSQVGDLQLNLAISPGLVGQNTFILKIASVPQTAVPIKQVLLKFTATRVSLPPSEIQLIAQGNGIYSTKGSYLSLPDVWQVQVDVQRVNQPDAYANFDFPIRNLASTEQPFAGVQIAGGLLVGIGLAFGLEMFLLLRRPIPRIAFGGIPVVLLAGLGILYLTRPLPAPVSQANPIPPNPASVEAGKNVYVAHCLTCHGETGKGDGPVGVTMVPRPADLSQHAVPGVHTDLQLFEWIADGFPGSRMPAFKASFSDKDIWNLVNYIRTLAPK